MRQASSVSEERPVISTGRVFNSEGRDLGPDLSSNAPSFEDSMIMDYIRSMRKDRQAAMNKKRK